MGKILYKELSYAVVGAAMEVHKILGPGFLEVVYQKALLQELCLRNIECEESKRLAVYYKGAVIGEYVADIVVDGVIILELKAVIGLHPKHAAQTLNYLKATGLHLGILLNFGEKKLIYERIVN